MSTSVAESPAFWAGLVNVIALILTLPPRFIAPKSVRVYFTYTGILYLWRAILFFFHVTNDTLLAGDDFPPAIFLLLFFSLLLFM